MKMIDIKNKLKKHWKVWQEVYSSGFNILVLLSIAVLAYTFIYDYYQTSSIESLVMSVIIFTTYFMFDANKRMKELKDDIRFLEFRLMAQIKENEDEI